MPSQTLWITYDPVARAAYIRLSDALVLTTREITDAVLVDLDADADVVGIELLDVQAPVISDRRQAGGTEGSRG